ncbi:hypothetical protein [Flavobacterium sp.]|jgi:hypothetical protein|uniref:hypothetical protein n=1 Tax=Flavobacterium sp. TaxID=239 RepID=UPI0037C176E0
MKKILFMFSVLLVVTGCEKKAPKIETKQENSKQNKQTENLDFFAMQKLVSGNSCEKHLIIIAKDKFSNNALEAQTLYDNFRSDYKDYLSTSTIGKSCGSEYSYFNVLKYVNKNKDFTKKMLSQWLYNNGKYICFLDTYPLIECVHKIDDTATLNKIDAILDGEVVKYSLTFNQIKSMIIAKGGKYEDDKYEYYLNFEIDWDDKIAFNLSRTFKPVGDYYSIPFIRSIYEVNSTNLAAKMDTPLEFFNFPLFSNAEQIIFRIKLDSGRYVYYDFSQIPPLMTGPDTYYNFSPL